MRTYVSLEVILNYSHTLQLGYKSVVLVVLFARENIFIILVQYR